METSSLAKWPMRIKETLVFSLWSLLAFIVFFSSIEEQVVVSKKVKEQVNMIFPEGWGFFTKNPRDLLIEVYMIDNGELKPVSMANHTFSNFLGLSRKTRVIGYEASAIANKVHKRAWKTEQTKPLEYFIEDKAIEVKGEAGFAHFVAGEYLFKLYKPVPYAWSKMNQNQYNPYTIAKLRIIPYDEENSTE